MRSAALRAVVAGLWASACVPAGGEGASASATASGSTMTSSTGVDGMSSTSVAGTTTSTSTSVGSSSSSSGDVGCNFLCIPDGGGIEDDCDVWAQNCTEGEKCTAWANDGGSAWNAHRCVPVVPDPDSVGEPCSVEGSAVAGSDSCDKGAMCWDVDPETRLGVCVGLCQGDLVQCTRDPWSCCPPGSACTISAMSVLILCLGSCNPLLQDCEGPEDGCYPVDDGFECASDVSGDMGAVGDPCEFINVCDPGAFCGDPAAYPGCDPNAAGCCVPFCSLAAPACALGTECHAWYDPMDVAPGFEDIGVCVIP
ncbi:MAG: ribulose phosphate epimerase [Nannocystaceae bacterium]